MNTGATNPSTFCVSGRSSLGKRHGGRKCVQNWRTGNRWVSSVGNADSFTAPTNHVYLGMLNPVRRKSRNPKCSKCGQPGRERYRKGIGTYATKDKGVLSRKILTRPLYSIVEPSEPSLQRNHFAVIVRLVQKIVPSDVPLNMGFRQKVRTNP